MPIVHVSRVSEGRYKMTLVADDPEREGVLFGEIGRKYFPGAVYQVSAQGPDGKTISYPGFFYADSRSRNYSDVVVELKKHGYEVDERALRP